MQPISSGGSTDSGRESLNPLGAVPQGVSGNNASSGANPASGEDATTAEESRAKDKASIAALNIQKVVRGHLARNKSLQYHYVCLPSLLLPTQFQTQHVNTNIDSLLNSLFPDKPKNTLNGYLDKHKDFTDNQQNMLCSMLSKINETLQTNPCELTRQIVWEVIESPTCFIGIKNALEQRLESQQLPLITSALFEQQFNAMILTVIKRLEQDILNDINARIFFDAPDPQSAHQIEPIRVWLDQQFGLYNKKYPEDPHNHANSYVNELIKTSFEQVIGHDQLTLNVWVDKINSQICEMYPSQIKMLPDYLNQLRESIFKNSTSPFALALKQAVDKLVAPKHDKPDDFELILRVQCPILDTESFLPSKRLLEALLKLKLTHKKPHKSRIIPHNKTVIN